MEQTKKQQFLKLIESNIKEFGHHITMVQSRSCPRFAYSIGLLYEKGFELIFVGGIYFMADEVREIMNDIAEKLDSAEVNNFSITLDKWGTFSILEVDHSWSELMMLGVFDFYKTKQIKAYQIIPAGLFYTNDVPNNMSNTFKEENEPVWKWLKKKWDLPVPENSQVATNLKALQGERIMEVMRWEEDYWEMFSEPPSEVNKSQHRIVPIGTMLGLYNDLKIVVDLEVGKGVWRESNEDDWLSWG